jgi:formylglycine-generating enzyme required for sulfatase activity/predicted nucleic acid-binding Zn ribbon protein
LIKCKVGSTFYPNLKAYGVIYCPRCQTENRRDSHFCYRCSYNFLQKRRNRLKRFVLLILFGFILLLILFLFFNQKIRQISTFWPMGNLNSTREVMMPLDQGSGETMGLGSSLTQHSEKKNSNYPPGVLVTASGLQLVQSSPPPSGKPRLDGQIPEPSSTLKALQQLSPSASGLAFIEEVPSGSGLRFVQQGSSGGMRVVQEIPASSGVQMVPLPSGENFIVLQIPPGMKVIQLPSFSSPSQPSSPASSPEAVVKETPSPEATLDATKPAASETPDSSKSDKKGKDSDSSPVVLIPAGYFNMGSPDGKGNRDEHPQHKVWVGAFYMDRYLATFDQYDKFCEATGRDPVSDNGWGRGKNPVINIKWSDADSFCKWAGKRLPTEAEWERAARGGTDTSYFFGDDESQIKDYAWYADNSGDKAQPVGMKQPNAFGLYDIVGNVWQWVNDWYGQSYYDESPAQNPTGPAGGEYRVLRGGSWNINADYLQSAHRGMDEPDHQDNSDGCRCAKSR